MHSSVSGRPLSPVQVLVQYSHILYITLKREKNPISCDSLSTPRYKCILHIHDGCDQSLQQTVRILPIDAGKPEEFDDAIVVAPRRFLGSFKTTNVEGEGEKKIKVKHTVEVKLSKV